MQEFQPNDTINNRYRVIRKLGAGAMGSVYLCEDGVENNIKVALKVLISENLDDQDVWAKGEYEALTRLRHPNLARVYNFGRIGETQDYFIVSEFIKGVDLFSATEYLHYDEVTDILVQVCRALEYIHSQGYVHFDIKPDNILVTRHKTIGIKEGSKVQYDDDAPQRSSRSVFAKPNVKLIDFGLAEKITGSFSFAIKGTLNYLAPEILNGATPDRRADLYSLGVTAYQVVNRDLPFYQDFGALGGPAPAVSKRSDLFEVHMKKHPDYLRDLILKLIEEDPRDRFQSAKEVIQFLNKSSGRAYELETEETRASYFFSPRLVGRKKEMNLLKRQYQQVFFPHRTRQKAASPGEEPALEPEDEVEESKAQLVLVSGEMGSGKSRLLEEFQHFLKLNDVHVYTGNCYEANQKAYQPLNEILRQVTYAIGTDSELFRKYEENILKLLPGLRERRRPDPHQKSFRPEKERHYFIDRISQLIVEAAQKLPCVLVINNLHWIDEASLEVLEKLLDRMLDLSRKGEPLKLLVLASQRSEEQSSEKAKNLIESMKESGFGLEVQVRRLKHEQVQEFLQAMLGLTEVPEDFVNRLEEQTGGNPLFIVETLKALEDEGIIKNQGDGWSIKATRYTRVEIPQRMEDLLLKRLTQLEPLKRELLEIMAVLDKPVSPKFLQIFKRFTATPLLVHLRDLESSGIISKVFENGKLHFQIEQPKVREILYAHLEESLRRQYHGEVGASFEEVYRHREEEILEDLAYHYQRSDKTDRAMLLALRAGDRLKAIYANERAHDYYQYVLEKVQENAEHLQLYLDTREKLGDLCTTMGRYEDAEEHYSILLGDECREMLPPERVTTLFLHRGRVFEIQGDYDSALKCYKDARNYLSSFDKDHQIVERAKVYNSIGWIYVCMGKYEKAMTISLEALRVISGVPEQIEHALIYGTIGSANFYKGNIREAMKYHRQSLQIKEHIENIPEITVSLNNLGRAHIAAAEYGEAAEQLRRALATSEEIGDPYGRAVTLHNLAQLHCAVGDLEAATEYLEESLRDSKNYNMRYLTLQNYLVRGMILREKGDYAKAEGNLFRALTAFSKQGNRAGLCAILLEIAAIHRLNGNLQEACSMVEEAKRYADELGIQPLRASSLLERARLMRADGQSPPAALELLEEALSIVAKSDNPEYPGEVKFEIAETLVCMREMSRATQLYKEAEERFAEVLESLPAEFKASYAARLQAKFRNWKGGGSGSQAASPQAAAPVEGKLSSAVAGAEECLRRVNQLMIALPVSPSLQQFLGRVLEEVLAASGAEVGMLLSLYGRNLSVVAARERQGGRPAQPGKLLCLRLIERCLRQQQPCLIEDVTRDPNFLKEEGSTVALRSLLILPFIEPGDKKGAMYLINPALERGSSSALLLLQPFLNLVPMGYLQFSSARVVTA
jgi:serine/threonine protein kinase/tetratricopeptide (TPR) repeat protein